MGWRPSADPYTSCACGSGKKYKFCCLKVHREQARRDAYGPPFAVALEDAPEGDAGDAPPFDFRAMEGALARFGQGLGSKGPTRAQKLIYRAWETTVGCERIDLAREALAIDPDCADAHFILAEEEAVSEEDKLRLYQQAVACAERALGQDYFEGHAGEFWGLLETRPYMRARKAVADLLHATGQTRAAAEHYRDLLRLNPNDNQGNRGCLAACLVELCLWDELDRLIKEYEEDAACWWDYSRAILRFMRSGGPGSRARELLDEAFETNPYVIEYLRGDRPLPRGLPAFIQLGEATEAVEFVALFGRALSRHPALIEWMCA